MQFSHKKGAAPFGLPRDAELQHDRLPANSQILLSGSDVHMICKLSSSSTILRHKSGGKCAIESPELKHVPMSGNICVLDIELSLQKRARRSCDGTVNDHTKRKACAAFLPASSPGNTRAVPAAWFQWLPGATSASGPVRRSANQQTTNWGLAYESKAEIET